MARIPAMRTLENALRRVGFVYVAGVDEVGRGCLAGPVVAAAVVLAPQKHIPGVSDSKLVPAAEILEHRFGRTVRLDRGPRQPAHSLDVEEPARALRGEPAFWKMHTAILDHQSELSADAVVTNEQKTPRVGVGHTAPRRWLGRV